MSMWAKTQPQELLNKKKGLERERQRQRPRERQRQGKRERERETGREWYIKIEYLQWLNY